jgi:hypothetical protein
MRTKTIILVASTLSATLSAAAPPTLKTAEPIEISKLNNCIQTRFVIRSPFFGMSRIGPAQFHGVGIFQPENPAEVDAVNELWRKGFEVAVYLVGRQALDERAMAIPPFFARRSGLQGPATFTLRPDTRLPVADALFSEGRAALASATHEKGWDDQGYTVKKGDWTVTLRPLRASNQTCIQCHTAVDSAPKVGDALGVVMYVYRHHE